MKTASIEKYHLSKLTEVFQKLLTIRDTVDVEGIIAVGLFHKAEQQLGYLYQLEEPSSVQIKSLENDLILLKRYIQHFEEYSQITKQFFQKDSQQIDVSILQSSYPFLVAQKIARQLFSDFIEGHYFDIGLQKSIDQLKHFIALFWRQIPSSKPKIPINELEIFQDTGDADFDLKTYLSERIDTTPNKISSTRIKQIKEGYYFLYQKSLIYQIQGKEYKLAKRIKFLGAGLRKQNEEVIYKALRLIQQLVQPTAITSPTNYTNTQQKLIRLAGTSEPDSIIILIINDQRPIKILVDKNGDFAFDDIELVFGDNILICYNHDFLFIDNHKYHIHIHLERHYPFIGMHDPLTQKGFQENEAQIIVRCTTCKNYEYDFSVEENNNRCVFPKCEGQEFWNWEDREYWMEM
ncbi:MAG: hypothetical protein R3E32_07330 [Chitinophagales bacterium]